VGPLEDGDTPMSKPGTGATAAAAALGAWMATPLVAMLRRGTLDEQRAAQMRRRPAAAPSGDALPRDAPHRDALRRARVREAQVRAAMAAVPAPRTGPGLADQPRRSPLQG
jgi:hypothetical protein